MGRFRYRSVHRRNISIVCSSTTCDEYAESESLEEPDPRVLSALLLAARLYRVGEQV